MAYNRINLLKKILEIQVIYLHYRDKGCTGKFIHNTYIAPNYHITQRTLSTYLNVNPRKELRKVLNDQEITTLLTDAKNKIPE